MVHASFESLHRHCRQYEVLCSWINATNTQGGTQSANRKDTSEGKASSVVSINEDVNAAKEEATWMRDWTIISVDLLGADVHHNDDCVSRQIIQRLSSGRE